MAEATFDSVEAIDRHFTERLASTPEAEKITVQLEHAQAKSTFFEGMTRKAQKENWIAAALKEFPEAQIADVRGKTEAEVRASAQAAHTRIVERLAAREAEVRAELEKQVGRSAYAGAAGGGAPVHDAFSPEALAERGALTFNGRAREGARREAGLNQAELKGRTNAHLDAILGRMVANS